MSPQQSTNESLKIKQEKIALSVRLPAEPRTNSGTTACVRSPIRTPADRFEKPASAGRATSSVTRAALLIQTHGTVISPARHRDFEHKKIGIVDRNVLAARIRIRCLHRSVGS